MGVNSALARVYGSELDAIFVAPLGTALPDDINDPLAPAFDEVGWFDDSGIVEANTGSKTELRGHQGAGVVRTRMTEGGKTFAFSALEDKPLTRELWDNVRSVESTASGARKETVSPNQKVSARTAIINVIDADDETLVEKILIPRLEITPDGDRSYVANALSVRGFIGQVIGNFYRLTGEGVVEVIADENWTVTIAGAPTGGTFQLAVNGYPTAPIAYNAAAAAVSSALNALSGVTGVTGVATTGTYEITFPEAVALTATSALTGGTAPTVTVAGA